MTTPIFNFDKTLQSAMYVAEKIKVKDFHRIFKLLFFADREHLIKYGRTITGDTYIKMTNGPVPTNLYDVFKSVRDNKLFQNKKMKEYFTVHGEYLIKLEKEPDLKYLSKTDITELDKSIAKYGKLPFGILSAISHGMAWEYADDNKAIIIENILREVGEDEGYIAYVTENINCQKAFA